MNRYQEEIRRVAEKSGFSLVANGGNKHSLPRRRLSNGSDHASSSSSSAGGTPTGGTAFVSVAEQRSQYLQKINQLNGMQQQQPKQQHHQTLPLRAFAKSNSGSSLVNNGRSTMASRRASASPPTRVIIDKSATAAVAAKINAAGSRTPPVVVNANGYGFIKDCTDVKNGNSALSPLPPPVQSSSELIQTSYRPGCYPQQQSSSTLSNIPIYENLNDNEPSVPLRASRVPPPPPPPPPPYVAKAAVIESPPVLPPKGRPPYLAPPVYENVYEEDLSSTLPGEIMT